MKKSIFLVVCGVFLGTVGVVAGFNLGYWLFYSSDMAEIGSAAVVFGVALVILSPVEKYRPFGLGIIAGSCYGVAHPFLRSSRSDVMKLVERIRLIEVVAISAGLIAVALNPAKAQTNPCVAQCQRSHGYCVYRYPSAGFSCQKQLEACISRCVCSQPGCRRL